MSKPQIAPTLYNVSSELSSTRSCLHSTPEPMEFKGDPDENMDFMDENDRMIQHAQEHASACQRSMAILHDKLDEYIGEAFDEIEKLALKRDFYKGMNPHNNEDMEKEYKFTKTILIERLKNRIHWGKRNDF